MTKNYVIKFVKRPGVDKAPQEDNFSYEECSYPEIKDGEMIIKTLYLSVDPVQRFMMNETSAFTPVFQLGDVIMGMSGVGVVVESKHSRFNVGDVVSRSIPGQWPWKVYFETANADNKFVVSDADDPKYEVSYYGMPGRSVMAGFYSLGKVVLGNTGNGRTFMVSGAMGSCGHIAGQIARINGCSTVVGIAGSDEKCKLLTDQLKFTNAINYKTDDVAAKIKEYCVGGVDVYFDNVGGEISEAVIKQMNENGVVIVCGQISGYNQSDKAPVHTLSAPVAAHVEKMKIVRSPFLVSQCADQFPYFREELRRFKREGGMKVMDSVIEGMENLPKAFCGIFGGKNIGKQVIKISNL